MLQHGSAMAMTSANIHDKTKDNEGRARGGSLDPNATPNAPVCGSIAPSPLHHPHCLPIAPPRGNYSAAAQ